MQISGRCFDTKERCHTATADKRNSQFTREGKHIQEKVLYGFNARVYLLFGYIFDGPLKIFPVEFFPRTLSVTGEKRRNEVVFAQLSTALRENQKLTLRTCIILWKSERILFVEKSSRLECKVIKASSQRYSFQYRCELEISGFVFRSFLKRIKLYSRLRSGSFRHQFFAPPIRCDSPFKYM